MTKRCKVCGFILPIVQGANCDHDPIGNICMDCFELNLLLTLRLGKLLEQIPSIDLDEFETVGCQELV